MFSGDFFPKWDLLVPKVLKKDKSVSDRKIGRDHIRSPESGRDQKGRDFALWRVFKAKDIDSRVYE